jgi:hypothetical protein
MNQNNVSRITLTRGNQPGAVFDLSNFCEDSKLMEMIINNNDFENNFDEIDMKQIDEEDK